jgi:predicted metal-dependent hydrolase
MTSDAFQRGQPSPLPPYVLRRSARSRRLRLTIHPTDGLVVTVPPATRRGWAHPEADIERFLREREPWIRRHLARQASDRAELATRGGLRDGASIRYRGEFHRLRITDAPARARRSSVIREGAADGDELVVQLARADRRPVAAVLEAWFRDRARVLVEREIARHAAALDVSPAAVTIRDQRSRWGSASRQRRLSFSWRLVLAPPEALESVVVHELAHLRVFGHGPRFWAVVASRRPDHLAWRRWLRVHSLELHAALDDAADATRLDESAG